MKAPFILTALACTACGQTDFEACRALGEAALRGRVESHIASWVEDQPSRYRNYAGLKFEDSTLAFDDYAKVWAVNVHLIADQAPFHDLVAIMGCEGGLEFSIRPPGNEAQKKEKR